MIGLGVLVGERRRVLAERAIAFCRYSVVKWFDCFVSFGATYKLNLLFVALQ